MCAHQVLTGSSPHFLGLAERWAKQNFRVTSKADEKTFSVHNSIVSFFQGMSCLLCCAQKYLCIMSQDFKSTNRKKFHLRELFSPVPQYHHQRLMKSFLHCSKIFCLLALLAMIISTCPCIGSGCSSVRPDINLCCCHQKRSLLVSLSVSQANNQFK